MVSIANLPRLAIPLSYDGDNVVPLAFLSVGSSIPYVAYQVTGGTLTINTNTTISQNPSLPALPGLASSFAFVMVLNTGGSVPVCRR